MHLVEYVVTRTRFRYPKISFATIPCDLTQEYIYYNTRFHFLSYYSIKEAGHNSPCHFALLPLSFTRHSKEFPLLFVPTQLHQQNPHRSNI